MRPLISPPACSIRIRGVFLPELKALLPGHIFVERTNVSAFETPALRDAAASTGRKTIITAGVATDIGLLYAALGAKAAGYDVWAVLDASETTDAQAEEIAKLRLVQSGIGVVGWASLAAGLMADFAGPQSLDTMALLAQRMESSSDPFH
jgi:nicotinamidase-related amidase